MVCHSFDDSFRSKILMDVRAGKIPCEGSLLLARSREEKEAENPEELLELLPFRMMCETLYGGKEGYHDIVRQFRQFRDRDYDRMMQGACSGDADACRGIALFLTACTDTLEFTSAEIYEHYRYLEELIRQTVRRLAGTCWQRGGIELMESETAEMLGNAVLKACRMNVLLQEKYECSGLALLARSRS